MRLRIPRRWNIAFKAMPFVVATAMGKVLFSELGWENIALNPLYTALVTGDVFLLGFMLAGTLADYKESEKLPGELAASMETIADECVILCRDKQALPARDCLKYLRTLADTLKSWLRNRDPSIVVLDQVSGLNAFFLEFESLTQPNFIVRLKQEQHALRRMVIRIDTIRETSFIGAGYAVVELMTLLLVGGLLAADFGSFAAEVFLTCTITFLLVYMILLIRDVDDPFDYDGDSRVGSAEVSLAPLDYVTERMAGLVDELDTLPG